jgi:predicted AlkP superfamily phosphohydrolase/phosphomutase
VGSYETPRFSPSQVAREPFWNQLSRAGRRVAIVDVPKTVPSAALNGCQLVDWGTHDPDHGYSSSPRELAAEVKNRFGHPLFKCDHLAARPQGLRSLRDQLISRIETKLRLCEYLYAQGKWDLFATVLSESHCAGHQFWHLHDRGHPRHEAALAQELGDPILQVYKSLDMAVGRLLEQASPETTVIVLASHGMGPHYDATFLLDEILHRLQDAPLSQVGRIGSGLLRRGKRRIPRRVRELLRPLLAWIRGPRDAGRAGRECFKIPNNDVYGAVRINQIGREPHGRVPPGAQSTAFAEQLTRDLLQLTTDTGEPVVRRVLRSADLYDGALLSTLPDLLIEWNREKPITCVHSPKIGTIRGRFPGLRTGDHKSDGLMFALGPSIKPGRLEQPVSVMDFAPTIGALLGVPLPDVDGRVIEPLTATSKAL